MTLADAFSKEDRVNVTYSNFYKLMKEAAKAELIANAVNCNVPHRYMREMLTGSPEEIHFTLADFTVAGDEKKQPCGCQKEVGEKESM